MAMDEADLKWSDLTKVLLVGGTIWKIWEDG